MFTPAFSNVVLGTAVRLSGSVWASAGSFCAVTMSVGS
jgi:hypothetical protein